MRLIRSLVVLLLISCVLGAEPARAQIPISEPLTLVQALGNAKRDNIRQWGAERASVIKRQNAKFNQLKAQYVLSVKSASDKAQHAQLRERYDAEVKVMQEANRAELEKAYADNQDTYKYNVEQIKRSYGVL